MNNKIIFTDTALTSKDYYPTPASQVLPSWYKKTDSYVTGKKEVLFDGNTSPTIKRCIPVFDALTAGYIIPTYCDLWVSKDSTGTIYYRTSLEGKIQFHDVVQAPYHPLMNNNPYPKWINPWGIQTPKGYSSLFVNPVHKVNNFFSILEGFVDTDTYNAPVNFPFVLNDPNFEGLIPAGTPMVQVIPIKREKWKFEIGSDKKTIEDVNIRLFTKHFDRYKNMFWHKKEFK
jgi:hypothetical protein